MLGQPNASAGVRNRHSFGGKGINDETLGVAAKQFGLGKFNIFRKREMRIYFLIIIHLLFPATNFLTSIRRMFSPPAILFVPHSSIS